ncbi:UDP-3-O-(3-hydroxymyristoyl)glucosamine N-acyltransferase [Natroniella sulfidigena]|uniref:UDP-3-O-(3-hydroxymyristoyl)glucosamine N-acyltransferase n=1 Tax=Natroniella sulfidigena TaxID=723921 RepID=UPI002009F119|nr:UDP-3-O-(3-hydroxymyristoyl)glucosamine N-acyltransferase [Natroniella sulfidigena]MCK8816372.1 UDP-3-O-(3-hydroxymyristoyl)glucosamine N-acyltransferase [Natroniella sulfidigena]
MGRKLKELAQLVTGEVVGDQDFEVEGVGGADNADSNQVTFALNQEFFQQAVQGAGAIIVTEDLVRDDVRQPLIVVENPRLAFAKIAKVFMPQPYERPEISKQAVVSPKAEIGEEVSIHPGVVIEAGAKIGDRVILAPGVYIGHDVEIGQDSIIHPNVVIEYECKLGNKVEVNAGAVIGCQGYGFETGANGHEKVPQFGNVVIEDRVELGANVTIDRAATGSTVIAQGTKVDNLVHIAHNVEVGADSLLIAQVGIAGSTKLGERVTLAGKSGVVGHLEIGDDVTVGAYSAVTNDVADDSFVSGYPAHDHRQERRIKAARKKLPQMMKKMRKLEKKVAQLEEKLNTLS